MALPFSRSLLIGAATGGRSFSGLCGVSLTSGPADGPLNRMPVKALVTLAATAELVGDQLPRTPSRLGPPGLGARIVLGGASAGLLARRQGASPVPEVAVGIGAAVGAAVAGHWFRAKLSDALGTDVPGALLEDAVVLALTWLACAGSGDASRAGETADDDRPVAGVR